MKKNYGEVLTERFGTIGTVIAKEADFGRFPATYHHDYVRSINENNLKLEGLGSRGEVSQFLRGQVPEEDVREWELIKGAIGYIMEYRSDDILAEILANPEPALIKSYQDMQQFSKTLWYWQLPNTTIQ